MVSPYFWNSLDNSFFDASLDPNLLVCESQRLQGTHLSFAQLFLGSSRPTTIPWMEGSLALPTPANTVMWVMPIYSEQPQPA